MYLQRKHVRPSYSKTLFYFESNPSLLFIYRVIWLVLRRIYWKTYSWGTKQLGEVINRVESQHLQLIGHKYGSSIEKRFQPFGILVARNLLPFVALIIYILHFWKPSLKKNFRTKCRYREVVGKGLIVKDSDKGLMLETSAYGCNNETLYDMSSMTFIRMITAKSL